MVSYLLFKTLKLVNGVATAPVIAPYKGVKGVFETIHQEARDELLDEDRIIERLTEVQLQLDMEEIEQEEYDRREKEIMDHLAAVRKYKRELERHRRPTAGKPAGRRGIRHDKAA